MTDKHKIKICKYYKSSKKCTFEGNCAEQYFGNKANCCSKLYYSMDLEEKLKQKEQECERLKDKLNCCFCNPHIELNDIEKLQKCVEVTECFRRQLDQLKAENEELKRELKVKGNILKLINEAKNEYSNENKKLKQTLTEIKVIAEANKNYKFKITEGVCIGDTVELKFDVVEQILNKIKEVEDVSSNSK